MKTVILSAIITIIVCAIVRETYVYLKHKNGISKRHETITYRNLYISQGGNDFVYGLNEYPTQELAKHNQQCPPGFRWHSAISSRKWA